VLGGVFTQKTSWRWCFFINLPLAVLTMAGTTVFLKTPADLVTAKTIKERFRELDYIGLVLFIAANFCLLLAVQWGGVKLSWSSATIVCLFTGFAVLISIWFYLQFRLGEKATLPPRILLQRTALTSLIFAFLSASAIGIPQFYFPLFLQVVKDYSPIASGVYMLPYASTVTLSSAIAGLLLTRLGYCSPFMITGGALLAVGTGLLGSVGVNTNIGNWVGYQLVTGFGAGASLQVSHMNITANEGATYSPASTGFHARYPYCQCNEYRVLHSRANHIHPRCPSRVSE
jgi:hypothetical protein